MIHKSSSAQEQDLIQSIIHAELVFQRKQPTAASCPSVITLSRHYGSGGEEIARLLAERLQVKIFDHEILDHISRDTFISKDKLSDLEDKSGTDRVRAWLRDLFSTSTTYPSYYRHHLVNVVLHICQTGGIIIGRGAHIILATRPAFRVRIVGNIEDCSERVSLEENIDHDEARKKVLKINAERENYLLNIFGRPLHDASFFDLVINTDKYTRMEDACDVILHAMGSTGHCIPPVRGTAL